MADVVCSKCDVGWVIYSHDKHCGYCGCKIFDFSVKWEAEPLLYADDGADIHNLTILVENTGAYPITFQPIGTRRDNVIQFPQPNDAQFVVKAGETYAVPIQVKPANLARYAEAITVRAQNAPSTLENEKSLRLQALSRPEFSLTPNPIVVRYRKRTETVTVDLHLEVLQSRFYFSSINFTQQWVKGIRCPKGPYVRGAAAKNVSLDIDCNLLNDGLNMVKLCFKLLSFSQTIEKQIQIQREIEPEPARLFVPKTNLQVTQEREKTYTLTLQNTGERPLTIKNIAFNDPSNLLLLLNVEYPINIEGGKHQNVEMLISADGVEPDTYPINFIINSNCEAASQYQDVLNVRVNKREAYPHYLAIDFGTTNSCCAYIGTKGVPQLIQLDSQANPPDIMPSSIIYRSQPANGRVYRVGYAAETDRTSEINGIYYISSVKRWLGYEWKRLFPNNLKLQPRDVVAHILEHIIEQAENHLDTQTTQSKITRCVIAHPTMFSTRQREDLKQAFEKIGITDLIFIDEASAASLGAISQHREYHRNLQGNYRLLVYDFGGGTIDIVLSQVTTNGNETTIEPLTHGGNPRYGGDDVTQAIVKFVLSEFRHRIQKEHPNLRFDIPYLSPRKVWQSSDNPKKDGAAQSNTPILYRRAEDLKRELSEQKKANRDFSLKVVVGNDVRPLESFTQGNINVNISAEQLRILIESELYQTFAEIDAMISETGESLPGTVILAGQSSKMPIVKELMATHFQTKYKTDVDIYLSKSPKECVAIGAAQYGMTHSSPTKDWIEIINSSKTVSRLGIMQVDGGKHVFGEVIPKGKLIPDESLGDMDISLRPGDTNIAVLEHFGINDELLNTSPINSYILTVPKDVPKLALRNASLQMAVKDSGEIEVVAFVDGKEYKSTVEKKKPEFVYEI